MLTLDVYGYTHNYFTLSITVYVNRELFYSIQSISYSMVLGDITIYPLESIFIVI